MDPRRSRRPRPPVRMRAGVVLTAILSVVATACSSSKPSAASSASASPSASTAAPSAAASSSAPAPASAAAPSSAAAGGPLKIAYLQKQADEQYFVDEANGAKTAAATLNTTVTLANLGTDANKAITEVQAANAQKVSGIIIVPPDPSVGPQVIQLAKAANIPIISSDDQVCATGPDPSKCAATDLLPRVGFSGTQMGTQVGQEAGQLFKAAGWTAANTKILAEWQQDVTVCTDRTTAAKTAFAAAAGVSDVPVIEVGTDNSVAGAQTKTAATMTANHGVQHWVVWGCNDENVQGAVTALQNGGVNAANIIGVGLGAYLACKDWAAGAAPSGMKAALFISGEAIGKTAITLMHDHITAGKAFPAEVFAPTVMVDPTNWKDSGLKCT
ncbi:MAG TPA: substrate-binding domain-containing protein [Acidothermaceae bacterium]